MSPTDLIFWGIVAALGIAGAAACSGLETGAYCLNRVRLHVRARATPVDYAARLLARELEHPERLLAANLIANSLFAYLGATGVTAVLDRLGYSDAAKIGINVLVLTPVFLVLVESLPKEVFRSEADRLMYTFAPALTVARLVLTGFGVLPLVRGFADGVARLIGGEGEAGLAQSGRERLNAMIRESAAQGALSPAQAALVDRAVVFHRLTVGDEMVPWARVTPVPADWDRTRLLALLARTRHTWLPVVDPRSGGARVLGVLRHTDLYVRGDAAIESMMVQPARLPPGTPLAEAVVALREARAPVGIVEHNGKAIGLVTIKDLVEPLTGELLEW